MKRKGRECCQDTVGLKDWWTSPLALLGTWILGWSSEKKEVDIRKEYKKTSGGHGYVNDLNCGDGFTYVKTSNCTL